MFLGKPSFVFVFGYCLASFAGSVVAVQPLNRSNIDNAIQLWQENQTAAEELYGGSIEDWDTSQVTSMTGLFEGIEDFDADLSNWNTSAVTNMNAIFSNTKNFSADVSTWDTSAVTDSGIAYAFRGSVDFSADVSTWDTSGATQMYYAFDGSENFAADLSTWDVTSVTDMQYIFHEAKNFSANVSTWDTSQVKDMACAFYLTEDFTSDVSQWNLSAASGPPTDQPFGSLRCAVQLWLTNQILAETLYGGPIEDWDTSQLTRMENAFIDTENFSADLSKWSTSAVTYMRGIFYNSKNFGANVSAWDTSQVKDLGQAFSTTENFTSDISSWKVSAVTNMYSIFEKAKNFGVDVSAWDTSQVDDLSYAFVEVENFTADVSNWNTSKVQEFTGTFYNAPLFNTTVCWDLSSAIPSTLTQFSCSSNGGLDCSCSSLDPSNQGDASTNLCSTINSACFDLTPVCISVDSAAKSTPPNYCAGDVGGDTTGEAVERSSPANVKNGDYQVEDDTDILIPAIAYSGGHPLLPHFGIGFVTVLCLVFLWN